ncbi:MAG TPA: Ig-like domain-containing protein [Anaerolineae bacterium]|nr:Ig-like domain-containing protein [Anaerolineae bacterium]
MLTDKPIVPSPLASVENLPYVPQTDEKPEFEIEAQPKVATDADRPVTPTEPALVLGTMPTPTLTFDAMTFNNNGAGHPPDTNGDIGINHFMEAVNTSIGIYTKTTGSKATSFTFNSFWSGAGTGTSCDTANQGDPIVLYDTINQRWIFMDFSWSDIVNGPYYFCFGVSQTRNPLGGYWRYAIRADDASHPWLPDYPKGGVWPDGLYFSANMFDCLTSGCASASYKEARAYAFNLQKMEAGQALTANDVQAKDTSSSYFTLMPSNVRGTLPSANIPNYFVSEDQVGYFWDVFKFHVDFTTPANSTFTGPTQVTQASYATAAGSVPEPSPGNNSDTLADRAMFLNQYRNLGGTESLWVQHTTGTASASMPTGIQWAQINVTSGTINTTPVQQQIFNNGADGLNRFMGSLAVDQQGNVALGYSASSSSVAPDIRYVGRLVTDPLNQMPQAEVTLLPGVTRSVQTGNCGSSACTRWGDYSAMTVDPVDDCTFWYTNMYFPVQGTNWVTRIGSFKFPLCGTTQTLTPTVTSLTSFPNPSAVGQSVMFTATVSATGPLTPTGTVTFTIDTGVANVTSLSNGVATFVTSALLSGMHPVTATYGGDTNFSGSLGILLGGQVVINQYYIYLPLIQLQ